jgi:hypothetical protein
VTTETQLKNWVIEVAQRFGWLIHHDLPAQFANGRWATPIQGFAGFPDLVLAHPTGQLLFAELKSDKGKTSTRQDTWLEILSLAGVENYIWRPNDKEFIQHRLTRYDLYK